MLHVCFPQRFMTLMLLIETSQLVALHTWKNQHVYAHRAAAEKNMVIHGRDKCLAVMLNKMHVTNSTLCFRLRWRRRWVQSLFCLCVSVCIYSEGQFMREPTSVGRTFFFVFQMCVCVCDVGCEKWGFQRGGAPQGGYAVQGPGVEWRLRSGRLKKPTM